MKQRFEIKALAKASFKEQRRVGILIFFILLLIAFGGSLASRIPILGPLVSLAVSLIIVSVMEVGLYWGYLKIFRKEQTEVGVLFSKFNSNDFGRSLGGILWMVLFLFLWSLIPSIGGILLLAITLGENFVNAILDPHYADYIVPMLSSLIVPILGMIVLSIPAIIKYYSYSMTPFVLADCPNVKATEAIKKSMKLTKGYKGKLFVLDLSFIGWGLLSCLTLGILAIVYVLPYYTTTWAGYYEELKAQALEAGAITAEELA